MVQLRPFKSENSAQVTSLTIVADETNIRLFDGDGSLLSEFDLTESGRGKPLKIIRPPNAGDLLFGLLFENEAAFFRIRLEETKKKDIKRPQIKEEWTRLFSEFKISFSGSDVQDIHIAKRAGRYISVAFVNSADGSTIITIMNRDKTLDTQESAG